MEKEKNSSKNLFMLSGFPFPQDFKLLLLLFFLVMFILTLFGNSLIIGVVISNLQLHKPMYWFLCHLSILDMAFSSVVVPKVIAGFIPGGKVISFKGCATQLLLYTLMAYDRFLAICKPIHYGNIMNWKVCLLLCLGTVIGGSLNSTFQTFLTFHLPYGQKYYIDYVFCDIPAMLKLACVDTKLNELMSFIDIGLVAMTCFLLILASYVYIILAILKISSSEGQNKAFSTCTLSVIHHYLRTASQGSMDSVVNVFYTTVTPLLNPLIYTLRNKEMKAALVKLGEPGEA
uniref:G-protein coupled receptors family 1 profile domain-containing protein n=1 Tax=Pseudonaja textilis TaxID=8673 RepID=A0A670YSX5_PSETE